MTFRCNVSAQSYIVASLPFIIGETDSASCAMVRDSPRLEKFPLQWRNGSNIINNDEIRTSLIPRSTYFSYTSTIGFVTTAFMNNDVLSCAAPVHSESETKVKIHVQSKWLRFLVQVLNSRMLCNDLFHSRSP